MKTFPMTLRRAVIALLVLAATVFVVVNTIKRSYANEPARAYARLDLGMTREQVYQAVGVRPGEYHADAGWPRLGGAFSGPFGKRVHEVGLTRGDFPPGVKIDRWDFDEYWIWVWFGDDGKVVRTELLEVEGEYQTTRPPLFERVRNWLGI